MLKYLIIQLDDTSVSFCHYQNDKTKAALISLDVLKESIFWSMKENLTIQFIYPEYILPDEYKSEISKTFHADIVPSTCKDEELLAGADVVVYDTLYDIDPSKLNMQQSYVFRLTFDELFGNCEKLHSILPLINRVNIVITDILSFTNEIEKKYESFLTVLSDKIVEEYKKGHKVQVNLLTDRILLEKMNNCNAGDETVTICPDGNFYVCPAFYTKVNDSFTVGNVDRGLDIKNQQLYRISHAPICRICDAFQCRRCVWLNRKSTLEVNTPSREQCVVAHIERNAARKLLNKIHDLDAFMSEKKISEIDYLDPFDKIKKLL